MKKAGLIVMLMGIFMSTVLAQEVENMLSNSHQKWLDKDWPVTDTLQFSLPNEGKVLFYYNDTEFSTDELRAELEPLMKRATRFPEFETKAFRLANNFGPTSLGNVKNKIDRNYVRHIESIELGIPVGIDYTAGYFTPEVGFRALLSMPGYSLGASITNTVYFPDREAGELEVNSNWFLNAEFSWNKGQAVVNNEQTIQLGVLLNQGSYKLFQGTSLRAVYRHRLSKHLFIQAGLVATDNLKTVYPTIGVRFW
ncbi:hypothetical protein [Echinicola salinicaeni]|uniref:hypothetical protein n=1 Tax=Echinicola salinicaeni TaxID=2762757 RepID=UPI001648E117|nr:hypothetical protein [Echinicola salinicaeni]